MMSVDTTTISYLESQWLQRENNYQTFTHHLLTSFWLQRKEWHFIGKNNIVIQGVSFKKPSNDKVIIIVNGFNESYLMYQEVIFDLFHSGYDIITYDHRGQGLSERILDDSQRAYVDSFTDYVEDLTIFWQNIVEPVSYRYHFLFAHSMGGAISWQFLLQHHKIDAVIMSAPMTGIALPMPVNISKFIITLAENNQRFRCAYAARLRKPLPFLFNVLTHSSVRYQCIRHLFEIYPQMRLIGPTWHWLYEAFIACQRVQHSANELTIPLLVLQAGQEKIVNNRALTEFYQKRKQTNLTTSTPYLITDNKYVCCQGDGLIIFKQARHDILFEKDETRSQALKSVLQFFAHYQ